jgi:hypothetical protein
VAGGYDAGKKLNGRKRHIAVDAIGLLLTVLITAAGGQDRGGAKPLLRNLRRAFPSACTPSSTAPPLGRRADPGMDYPPPPHRPRRRTPARAPRNRRVLAMTITITRRLARRPAAQSAVTSG